MSQLGQGVLLLLSPSLVKRQKTHFHNLPCGASIILGNNGFVWLYPTPAQLDEEAGGFYTSMEVRLRLITHFVYSHKKIPIWPIPITDKNSIYRPIRYGGRYDMVAIYRASLIHSFIHTETGFIFESTFAA